MSICFSGQSLKDVLSDSSDSSELLRFGCRLRLQELLCAWVGIMCSLRSRFFGKDVSLCYTSNCAVFRFFMQIYRDIIVPLKI